MSEPYKGFAVFSSAYRIFFFSAACWAFLSLILWVLYLSGQLDVGADALSWHAHELIYGYGGAVVAGFAFTAIPNWTGRVPVRGFELMLMFIFWFGARIGAVAELNDFGTGLHRAGFEAAFFLLFVALAAREVTAGKNWRNMKIIVFFSLFALSVITTNLDRLDMIMLPFSGWLTGLGVLLLLISVIGGRIIPAFTKNWMMKQGEQGKMPIMFGKFDAATILLTLFVFVLFITGMDGNALAAISAIAALLHFVRLLRWRGTGTGSSPIVAVLHISYLWVPVGFILLAISAVGFVDQTTALHAWTIGGIGSTTLAVMSRASLGHAGLPLLDSKLLTLLYASINLAAVARILAGFLPDNYDALIHASAGFWCAAFALFIIRFAPIHFAKA